MQIESGFVSTNRVSSVAAFTVKCKYTLFSFPLLIVLSLQKNSADNLLLSRHHCSSHKNDNTFALLTSMPARTMYLAYAVMHIRIRHETTTLWGLGLLLGVKPYGDGIVWAAIWFVIGVPGSGVCQIFARPLPRVPAWLARPDHGNFGNRQAQADISGQEQETNKHHARKLDI